MDNSKSQVRFIKVLLALLIVVVVAQCTFWLSSFSTPTSSNQGPIEKIRSIDDQRKVVAPVVIEFLEAVHGL